MNRPFYQIFLRVLPQISFVMLVTASASAQCKPLNLGEQHLSQVSEEYRSKLVKGLTEFYDAKCEKDFHALYKILLPSVRERNTKADLLESMTSYYAHNNQFLSFRISKISEFRDPTTDKAIAWYLTGCVTERIRGRHRSAATILEAILHDGSIYFSDIDTRPSPIGDDRKC